MPETYTVPIIATTNAIIASSDANVDKGDIRYYRQYLSADPGSAGKFLLSDGANSAGWATNFTTLPTFLGNDLLHAGNLVSLAQLGVASNFTVLPTYLGNNLLYNSGPISGSSYAGGSTGSGAPSVLGLSVGTSGVSTTGQLASTVATGTAPLAVASTTEVANLNAAALSGFDWKRGLTAERTTSQALTTSYADVTSVSISADRDGQWEIYAHAEFSHDPTDGMVAIKIVSGGVDQEEGFGLGSVAANRGFAFVSCFVVVSGTTTIKLQVEKASGTGATALEYAKLMAKWIAP